MQSKVKLCSVKEVKGQGILTFTLTRRVVDRDSEVIEPAGGRLDNYKKNPVFLWAHDLKHPPVGKVLPETIKKSKDELIGDVQFDLDDPFARLIYNKYEKGFLNAGSIRFLPIAYSREPVLPNQKGVTVTEWELLEFSAVPVPANPAALKKEFGDDAENQDWYQGLKSFFESDEFEHTPEGWLEFIRACKSADDDEGEPFDAQKPYPNEHACRLKDPKKFVRFVRQKRKHEGKEYSVIIGYDKNGKAQDQAYRYPKDTWTEAQARKHCKDHNGMTFEPAAQQTRENQIAIIKAQNVIVLDVESLKALNGKSVVIYHNEAENQVSLVEAKAIDVGDFLKDYDFSQFEEVVRAMNDLSKADNLTGIQKAFIYNQLAQIYKQFDKEPPEFAAVQKFKSLDRQEDDVDLDDSQVVQDIIDQVIKMQQEEKDVRDDL